MIETGKPAPAFDMPDDSGGRVRLRDFRGGVLVVYFYPKDDTSGCTLEAQQFSDLAAEFGALGARIVAVSPDSVASHCKFRDKYNLKVILASDPDHALCQAYGVWVEKSMYGRKYMGVERTTVLIDAKGRIARVWPKVKVPGHAGEVLAAVRALVEPKADI